MELWAAATTFVKRRIPKTTPLGQKISIHPSASGMDRILDGNFWVFSKKLLFFACLHAALVGGCQAPPAFAGHFTHPDAMQSSANRRGCTTNQP